MTHIRCRGPKPQYRRITVLLWFVSTLSGVNCGFCVVCPKKCITFVAQQPCNSSLAGFPSFCLNSGFARVFMRTMCYIIPWSLQDHSKSSAIKITKMCLLFFFLHSLLEMRGFLSDSLICMDDSQLATRRCIRSELPSHRITVLPGKLQRTNMGRFLKRKLNSAGRATLDGCLEDAAAEQ